MVTQMIRVYFFPCDGHFNPYISNIMNGLERNGAIIVNRGKETRRQKILSSLSAMAHRTEIYHLNWIENKSSCDTMKDRVICRAVLYWLALVKLSGGKLVWTMHNRESHHLSGSRDFHHWFIRSLISRMDMILVHAEETRSLLTDEYGYPADRILCVPHGSYIQSGRKTPESEIHERFTLLSFGMIYEYKNIPLLIRAFAELRLENAQLLICGKIDEKEAGLRDAVETAVRGVPNVLLRDAFVPEDKIEELFSAADIAVLPYKKQSMINSGTAVLALSEGKPILSSAFGAVRDMADRDFVYSYDYSTEEEHMDALKNAIKRAYEDWESNRPAFSERGRHAYEYAKNELSWDAICARIVKKYAEILSLPRETGEQS